MSGRLLIKFDDGQHHSKVEIAGEFTDWQPVALGLDKGTTYAAIFDGAEANESYQYKFIVNGQWTLLPNYPTTTDSSGFVNHCAVAAAAPGHSSFLSGSASPTEISEPLEEPYEFIGSQLDHAQEEVEGLDQVNTQTSEQASSNFNSSIYLGATSLSQTLLIESCAKDPSSNGLNSTAHCGSSEFQNAYQDQSAFDPATNGSQRQLGGDLFYADSQGYSQINPQDSSPYKSYQQPSLGSALGDVSLGGVALGSAPWDGTNSGENRSYNSHNLTDPLSQTPRQPYELNGADIDRSAVMVPGLDQIDQHQHYREQPVSKSYRRGSSDLERPVEVMPCLAEFSQTMSSELKQPTQEPYEMTGPELVEPVEVVSGLDKLSPNEQRNVVFEPTFTPYELTTPDLSKPIERVDEVHGQQSQFKTQDSSRGAEIAKESVCNMPGSLPYENYLVNQTSYSTGNSDPKSSPHLSQDDSYDTQNYESACEELEEPGFLAAALADVSLNNPDLEVSRRNFPTSTSDRTLKQNLEGSNIIDITKNEECNAPDHPAGSDQNIAKSETVILDAGIPSIGESSDYVDFEELQGKESPVSASQRQTKPDSPYGSVHSQLKKSHAPIDVNTGFPTDNSSSPGTSSNKRLSKYKTGPQLRNETRRPLSHAGVPVTAYSIDTEQPNSENRDAAVIAAASRASAYAKQDIAAISDPSQSHPPQSESFSQSHSDAQSMPLSTGNFNFSSAERRSSSSLTRKKSFVQLTRSDTKKESRVRRFFRKISGN